MCQPGQASLISPCFLTLYQGGHAFTLARSVSHPREKGTIELEDVLLYKYINCF